METEKERGGERGADGTTGSPVGRLARLRQMQGKDTGRQAGRKMDTGTDTGKQAGRLRPRETDRHALTERHGQTDL